MVNDEPTKREVLQGLLQEGKVAVHLDTTVEGVDVPPLYRGGMLCLNFSYNFYLSDLDLGEDEVSSVLSFKGETYPVVVPWDAIVAMISEVTGQVFSWAPIVVVPLDEEPQAEAPEEAEIEDDEEEPGRRYGHLRVVK